MKKYALITIHNAINHGAVLQALATQMAFMKCNCMVTVIDYVPQYICEDNRAIRRNKGIAVKILDCILNRRKKVEKFQTFINKNLNLTEKFYSLEEISGNIQDFDGIISGSDQIWNPSITGGNLELVYFCAFAKPWQKIISYASSFGDNICFEKEIQNIVKNQLEKFSFISVREESGVRWLKNEIGLTATKVADPTLLLSRDEWNEFAKQSKIKMNKPYIFVYSVGRTKELIEYAKTVQKILKFDIVVLNAIFNYPFKNVRYVNDDSPEDFLYLLSHAAMVITSSYHGMLFSVNFNIPFLAFPASEKIVNRSVEFLKLIDLEEQFTSYHTTFSKDMLKINWNYVNEKINMLRADSYAYILQSVGEEL